MAPAVQTSFPHLNEVLALLVSGIHRALPTKVHGIYLQGSFALGDADEFSDVDFVVVTDGALDEADQAALQELHGQLFNVPVSWAQHLEGSYAPASVWRQVDPQRAPMFFLDNGARELVWDDHCNTAVVRWVVRERGVALAGPDPREVFDPVPSDDLRAEARATLDAHAEWAEESRERYEAGDALAFSRWKQPYLVLTFCRCLNTLSTGLVDSKREAGEWGVASLDSEWRDLIERALADRPDPWGRVHQSAPASLVSRTCNFAEYARRLSLDGSQKGSRRV